MSRSAGHGFRPTFCVFVFVFTALYSVEGNSCPTNWTLLEGSCFFFSSQTATWINARERCKATGGDLVTISSDTENAFVASHYSRVRCLSQGSWLGLHRHPKNISRWVWLDDFGSELKYTKWHRKEPMNDRIDKNCTEIHPTKSIYWFGRECTAQRCYICLRDANECNKKNICSGQPCVNILGSHRCSCGTGYVQTEGGTGCEDVNECKDDNGGCPHACINTPGGYVCHCRDGFITERNGTMCRPRIAEITTESTTEKQEQTADGNNRRTNKTQATKPTKPVSEESEQQTGSSDEVLEEPKPSPLASFGVLFTMAIPLCFIVCFLILCYLKGPGKDKSEKEMGISGRLIESVSPFLDTAFMDPSETNANDKGKKTGVKTTDCANGEDVPMV